MHTSTGNTTHKQNQRQELYHHYQHTHTEVWQNSTSLHVKALKELGTEDMLLNIIKALYDKPIANIILNKEKLKLFLLIRNETRVSPCHPCLSPCISINSKWIKDLNIRPETLKLVQERAGNTLEAIRIGKDFLSRTQLTQ
jgi:hypothetical protein